MSTFVFILSSTAKVISEHRPINAASGIEPGTLWFQANHEAHYDAKATLEECLGG